MSALVKCTWCGQKYDLTRVTVIKRYSDCTVFESPCCRRQVDDRAWKSRPDFEEVNHQDTIDKTLERGRFDKVRLEELLRRKKGY
jgi:hypothetical protein